MKFLLTSLIRLYWITVPKSKRRRCIFRTSCSKHVYQTTHQYGLLKGLAAFKYRFQNCRAGFRTFNHPVNGSKMIILPNGEVLEESMIAERFIA